MSQRSSPMVLASLVSLFVGGVLGTSLFGRAPIASAEARAFGPTAAPEPALRAAQPLVEAEVAPPLSPTGTATPARVTVSTRLERQAPPPPRSDGGSRAGRIGGSVVTLEGRPLAGVELELAPAKDAPQYRSLDARTAADGRFEFIGLPAGVWDLTARHPEYALQRRTTFPVRVPTGAEVDFLACTGFSVEVRVDGERSAEARVAYRRQDEEEPRWSTWSPKSPRLTLLPGAWELCASVDALEDWPSEQGWKLAPISSKVHTVHLGGGEAQKVVLELEAVNCLYGEVILPVGDQSEDGGCVRLIETLEGTLADFETPGNRSSRFASIDAQGRYGFSHLPCDRWTAGVASYWYWGTPWTARAVEVHGLTREDFDLRAEIGEGCIQVDAFGPAGQRITQGLSLSLGHRDPLDEPDDFVWQPMRTVLQPDGSLRVIALPMDADEAKQVGRKEQLFLQATMAGFAQIDLPLLGLDGEHHELRFTTSSELDVVLVGEGAERAMRECRGVLKGERTEYYRRFDEASGCLEFTGVQPGRYMLTIVLYGNFESWRRELLYFGEIDVFGDRRLEIPMPRRSDLVVRCPGVKEDASAALYGPILEDTVDHPKDWRGTTARADVDKDGVVRFQGMLEGTYRLTIGRRVQIVRVPSPPLDFDGRLPTRFRLRLTDGDSALRRAGARSGDLLVGLDGEELEKEAVVARLSVLSSQSTGRLLLSAERAGSRIDLPLDASDLKEGESFELDLEPVVD